MTIFLFSCANFMQTSPHRTNVCFSTKLGPLETVFRDRTVSYMERVPVKCAVPGRNDCFDNVYVDLWCLQIVVFL